MDYRPARADEIPALAVLRWEWSDERGAAGQPREDFVRDFCRWAIDAAVTHAAFVAADDAPVGMAWLARVARPPSPGEPPRVDGDLQSVFVTPGYRNNGVGESLIRAVLQRAWDDGLAAVSVVAGRRSVPLYERLGFTGHAPYLRVPHPAARA